MKIIKPGKKIGPPTWRVTCWRCDSELEYGPADVRERSVFGEACRHIICPACGQQNNLHDEGEFE